MICLTGDIHHMTLMTNDQRYLKGSELEAALIAAEIAKQYQLKYTLFCTGRCGTESSELVNKLFKMNNIEIGGHNYYAFKYKLPFKLYKKIFNLSNGPFWYQNMEVRKTINIFKKITGNHIRCWRDHAYRHDRNTINILKNNGIQYFSDILCGNFGQPRWKNGIINVPINTMPDHDYVYHGSRLPGILDENLLLRSPFNSKALYKEEWLDKIKSQVKKIESFNGIATMLVHPSCMKILDNFKTFTVLCKYLSQYKNCKMSEINI